jgi:transposase
MAKYRDYDYSQLEMVSLSLEEQLEPGTLEYAIHHIIEHRFDISCFNDRYSNDETGRRAINPKILLKIILLSYSRGITSSRPIERACRENAIFMALTCRQIPDHSTIAAFVSSMEQEIGEVFTQVLLVCEEEGLLGGTHFSLDGLKLPSNAAKEWSGTHSDLKKKQTAIEKKVAEVIKEHRKRDRHQRKNSDTEKERRKKRIQRLENKAKRIEKFLSENKPKIGKQKKEIQSNITDNESAKMATSHGVIQGYNANAMVDEEHQVIVNADAYGAGDDGSAMRPMLDGAKKNFEAIGLGNGAFNEMTLSADTGYYSLENLEACRDENVDAYIPDRHFRQRDPRFAEARRHRRSTDRKHLRYKRKKHKFTNDDFHFDDKRGKLICPAGHSLYKSGTNFVTNQGYIASNYKATITACRSCTIRKKCLRNESSPQRQVRFFHGHRKDNLMERMKQKIDTIEGREMYSKRLGIVEPVFGNIRAQKRMDRFTLRGQLKVRIQWLLYCIVHNIEKAANYGRSYAACAV